ncbi:MAG: hypothetical protein R3253_13335, partial [Longimicrobiales bacterium]|nr:hypothetical protein [Longimicrobiales bacterium]
GEVSESDVIRLLRRTRGGQYSVVPHHWDPATPVHVFRPEVEGVRWYIKAYFVEQKGARAVFMSVHR